MHIDTTYRRAFNIEPNMCWECYSCVKACPQNAIDVRGGRRPLNAITPTPTDAPAGSAAKIAALRRRAERGEELFHPADSPRMIPPRTHVWRMYEPPRVTIVTSGGQTMKGYRA